RAGVRPGSGERHAARAEERRDGEEDRGQGRAEGSLHVCPTVSSERPSRIATGADAGNPRGESGHQRRERLPTWVAAISGLGAGYRKWLLQCGTGSSAGAETNGEFDGNREGLQI